LIYNAIGRHIPGKLTAMESDNDSAARRIVMWDRMPGFSHIHMTTMFEVTITTLMMKTLQCTIPEFP
jgi:hypothetical protein